MRCDALVVCAVLIGCFTVLSNLAFAQDGCPEGFVQHPYVFDECYAASGQPCTVGGYCDWGETCEPDGTCSLIGAVDCGDGTSCDIGDQCMSGNGCMPIGSMDCGDGTYCDAGSYCVSDGCAYY